MIKPHRFILGQISDLADEGAAFLRRRRVARRPFARVYYGGGRSASYTAEGQAGRDLFLAAADLIDAAR